MLDFLKVKYAQPIEREYESWIIQEIENYFKSLGSNIVIFAISPQLENYYPADMQLSCPGLVVGLQFKRPMIDKNKGSLNDLYWSLGTPKGQFYNVFFNKEIYYCLPTFFNRDLKHQSLHHCLFWRPDIDTILQRLNSYNSSLRAKYDEKYNDRTLFTNLKTAHRWGYFLEEIFENGKFVNRGEDVINICNNWRLNESINVTYNQYLSILKEYFYDTSYSEKTRYYQIKKCLDLFKQDFYNELPLKYKRKFDSENIIKFESEDKREVESEGKYLLLLKTKT